MSNAAGNRNPESGGVAAGFGILVLQGGEDVNVDESSMCDVSLFYYLVRAVPFGAHLVIIGDADQLPSVGPGLVLRHLVDSGALPLTVLNQIYRQAEGSGITQLAHNINHGLVPDQTHFGKDCYFIANGRTRFRLYRGSSRSCRTCGRGAPTAR